MINRSSPARCLLALASGLVRGGKVTPTGGWASLVKLLALSVVYPPIGSVRSVDEKRKYVVSCFISFLILFII